MTRQRTLSSLLLEPVSTFEDSSDDAEGEDDDDSEMAFCDADEDEEVRRTVRVKYVGTAADVSPVLNPVSLPTVERTAQSHPSARGRTGDRKSLYCERDSPNSLRLRIRSGRSRSPSC